MNRDQEEKTVLSIVSFNRETLRRIHLMKSDKGNFCARIFILDPDSLQVSMQQSYWLEASLRTVIRMYLEKFHYYNTAGGAE